MEEFWHFTSTVIDGEPYFIEGLNIWDYDWHNIGEKISVVDPKYGQSHIFNVFEIRAGSKIIKFAAGEFSNCVFGIYLPSEND